MAFNLKSLAGFIILSVWIVGMACVGILVFTKETFALWLLDVDLTEYVLPTASLATGAIGAAISEFSTLWWARARCVQAQDHPNQSIDPLTFFVFGPLFKPVIATVLAPILIFALIGIHDAPKVILWSFIVGISHGKVLEYLKERFTKWLEKTISTSTE